MLDRFFHLSERGSTVEREVRGGLATFLTMSYILVANPAILAAAGVPMAPAVASTAIAAGIGCLMMGLIANFPVAMASGMGLNAFVAFTVAKATGSWQSAMGLIVWDGLVILFLVFIGVREAMMGAIPSDMRRAIGGGIGLFIAFIGAVNARMVIVPPGTLGVLAHDANATMPPVGPGSIAHADTAIALIGLVLTAWLMARRVRGSILVGIGACTAMGLATGIAHVPQKLGWPDFSLLGKADLMGALNPRYIPLLVAIVLVDFFDTLGMITAVGEAAGLMDHQTGAVPKLREILIVDSFAASIGGLCGASSVTCYIESAAGVAEGARTGLHSVVTGLLFLAAAVLAPLAAVIPGAATAPALILVGFLMAEPITRIDFSRLDTAIPAFITLVTIPFTYSITHGIGYGFITYVAVQVLSGKPRAVHPLMYGATAVFAYYFWMG